MVKLVSAKSKSEPLFWFWEYDWWIEKKTEKIKMGSALNKLLCLGFDIFFQIEKVVQDVYEAIGLTTFASSF
jgi:hypothetical protein